MNELDRLKDELARLIPSTGIIQFGQFTLASGGTSPVYVDWRRLRGSPQAMGAAVRCAVAFMEEEGVAPGVDYDQIADIPTGVTPFVAILAHELKVPQISPAKPKGHGTGATVNGIIEAGPRVVVWEDVTTTARSILEGIDILEAAGLQVMNKVFILADRDSGAREALAERGFELCPIFSMDRLMHFLGDNGLIEEKNYQRFLDYSESLKK